MASSRNRIAGHNWERKIVQRLNKSELLPEVGTTRELSPSMDSKKIDIMTKKLGKFKDMYLAIQAKSNTISVPYPKLLDEIRNTLEDQELEELTPVVFHKQTQKVGDRFMPVDHFALLFYEDFLKLFFDMLKYKEDVNRYKEAYKILNDYFEDIPEEEQLIVNSKLKQLNL